MPTKCECRQEKEVSRLADENIAQQAQIDERVKWTMFWAILLVIFGVLVSIINNVYSQLDATHADVAVNTARIESKLNETSIAQAKIDVQYVEIQRTLAEIKIQLSKIK